MEGIAMGDWTNDWYYRINEGFLLEFLEKRIQWPTAVLLVGGDDERKKQLADRLSCYLPGKFAAGNELVTRTDLSRITPDLFKDSQQHYHIFNLTGDVSGDCNFFFELSYKLCEVGAAGVTILWLQKDGSHLMSSTDRAIFSRSDVVYAPNRFFIVEP